MNKQALIAKCIETMAESQRPPTEVARILLRDTWSSLDDAVKLDLAVTGLGHIVAYQYSARRNLPQPNGKHKAEIIRATKKMSQRVGKGISDHASDVLRSISLYVGGKMRSLYDFTSKDVETFAGEAGSNARAWEARVNWCAKAKAALTQSNAKTLGELPIRLRSDIAKAAEGTWTHTVKLATKKGSPKREHRAA